MAYHQEKLERFFDRSETRQFTPDDEIISEGQDGNGFYYIETGKVHVLKDDPRDSSKIFVASLSDGSSFGEISVFSENPITATVVAKTNVTVRYFSKQSLDTFFEDEMQFGLTFVKNLLKRMSNRLRSTTQSFRQLKALDDIINQDEVDELMAELTTT